MKTLLIFSRTKKYVLLFLSVYFGLVSCTKDRLGLEVAPPNLGLVSEYLQELKSSTDEADKASLIELEMHLSNTNSKVYDQFNGNKAQIVDLKSGISFLPPNESAKVIFFYDDGKVVSSNIITFSESSKADNDIILAIFSNSFTGIGYSGKISLYGISGKLLLYNQALNGKIIKSGFVKPKQSDLQNKLGRNASGCTQWYLVEYYNGQVIKETYLYTTCDCDNQGNSIGSSQGSARVSANSRLNCGGGGGGGAAAGGGPNPPANPVDGQKYTHIDKDGVIREYIAYGNIWRFVSITLSPIAVVAQQGDFPNLVSDSPPQDGTRVWGNDTFLYTYNAWAGVWNGGQAYTDDFTGVLDLQGGTDPYDGPSLEELAAGPVPGVRWYPARSDYPAGPLGDLLFKISKSLYVYSMFPGFGMLRAPSIALKATTFNTNLSRVVAKPNMVQSFDAHHIFPQKFEAWFSSKNFNIHDPKFGAWWEASSHRQAAYNYNKAWENFIQQNPNATINEIWDFGKSLMDSYNVPYVQF